MTFEIALRRGKKKKKKRAERKMKKRKDKDGSKRRGSVKLFQGTTFRTWVVSDFLESDRGKTWSGRPRPNKGSDSPDEHLTPEGKPKA